MDFLFHSVHWLANVGTREKRIASGMQSPDVARGLPGPTVATVEQEQRRTSRTPHLRTGQALPGVVDGSGYCLERRHASQVPRRAVASFLSVPTPPFERLTSHDGWHNDGDLVVAPRSPSGWIAGATALIVGAPDRHVAEFDSDQLSPRNFDV